MKTASEMRAHIAGKAVDDSEFRAFLIENPKGAIERELGITIPDGYTVEVHEETGTTAHLVLPLESRLGPQELAAISGGGESQGHTPW